MKQSDSNSPPPASPAAAVADWLANYRDSVGPAAARCTDVLELLDRRARIGPGGWARMLELLQVLQALAPDPTTVSCALVLAAEQCGEVPADLTTELPPAVARQLGELHQLKHFEAGREATESERGAEGLRRLLLALVHDVRVVLVDLAWQLVRLRNAGADTGNAQKAGVNTQKAGVNTQKAGVNTQKAGVNTQKAGVNTQKAGVNPRALASETMLIHAPLANRLGVWQLKWELEDLAFRFREPEQYQRIARLVAEQRAERERFIEDFTRRLSAALGEAGIEATVQGRPKHIYSIYRKMQRKGVDFHELFDVRAVRVLVDDVPSCYSALGLVHTLWQPVPGEFDDYITTPKGNNYQSLHTAVTDNAGRAVEVQIRTRDMHEHAELGVAAHWRYKEGGPHDPGFEKKIAVMRQLLDASGDELDDESLLESFRSATTEDRVYVLTPRGQVIDLAAGSTVLDFAYAVHTEVGHRCRGAKVNGRIVPLTQAVRTGDRVEILTARHASPSRDWLNPRLGYLRSARARGKVRQWFKKESREDNLRAGREAIEAEARRLGLGPADLKPVARRFSQATVDDLCVAVGSGDLTVGQVVGALERLGAESAEPQPSDLLTRTPVRQRTRPGRAGDDIRIEGVGNLMTTIAKCCQPVPGDPVTGYVTRGRGVTIHREDCRQVLRWQRENSPRLLRVRWGGAPEAQYGVRLEIRAFDRRELIRDISNVLATSDTPVTDISSRLDQRTDEVTIRLSLRVRDYEQLSELLNRLSGVPNVLEARRVT